MLYSVFSQETDPCFNVVAVSWGISKHNNIRSIYQVQVAASDPKNQGFLDVSARVCIGGGNYFHDLGTIGTAADMDDAVKRFGTIDWQLDRLTIGGTDGVKTTLLRSELEKHR